jgi:hypothetical protein
MFWLRNRYDTLAGLGGGGTMDQFVTKCASLATRQPVQPPTRLPQEPSDLSGFKPGSSPWLERVEPLSLASANADQPPA